MIGSLTKAIQVLSQNVGRLTAAVAKLAVEPEIPMAERGVPALRISVHDEPGNFHGGNAMLAVAMNNRQYFEGTITPNVTDLDGQPIKAADGTPLDPAAIPVAWNVIDPNGALQPEIAADGKSFKFGSGSVGTADAVATIGPYPDGSSKEFAIKFAVGNSAPGDPVIAAEVKDEPAPSA